MGNILEVQQVTITYKDNIAVENVSFQVAENQILAIVGESGSGKSTLIRAIDGLLPESGKVTEGKILYLGNLLNDPGQKNLQKLRGKELP